MSAPTKMRLLRRDGVIEVIVLVSHPMEQGNEPRGAGNFVESLTFELNGTVVAVAHMGPGVAPNPLTSIALTHAKPGDRVRVHWRDNHGESNYAEGPVR